MTGRGLLGKGRTMERFRSFTFAVALSLTAVFLLGSIADADDIVATYWQHPPEKPGAWWQQANWTGGVPNLFVDAAINNGGTAVIESHVLPGTDTLAVAAMARSLTLGGKHSGAVDLVSGPLLVESNLWLGRYGYGSGRFNLRDGCVSAGNLFIDAGRPWYDGTAKSIPWSGSAFTQTGGSGEISGAIHVGYQPYPTLRADADGVASLDYTGGADEDYPYRPGATYSLVDGKLHSRWTYVGYGGKGQFIQTEGVNIIEYALHVGGGLNCKLGPAEIDADGEAIWPGPWYYGEGAYSLSGGELLAGTVHVGQRGRGRFTQTGGVARVKQTLQVGSNWWWWADPREADPAVLAEPERTSALVPAYDLPADGTYTLRRGTLATGNTEVGVGGTGRFIQAGGVHKVAGVLRVGGPPWWPILAEGSADGTTKCCPYPGPSRGSYAIDDGELIAGRIEIGAGYKPWPWDGVSVEGDAAPLADRIVAPWKPAEFRQTGGAVAVEGALVIRGGGYDLVDGKLYAKELQLAGRYQYDASRFVQTGGVSRIGGVVSVGGDVYVNRTVDCGEAMGSGFAPHYATETLLLAGGEMDAGAVQIGGASSGVIYQTNGALTVRETIGIDGTYGTYNLLGGSLRAPVVEVGRNPDKLAANAMGGHWNLGRRAKVEITDKLVFGPHGRFTADSGSTVSMTGADLVNYSTRSAALPGLDRMRMVFSIGPEDDLVWETYEVAGEDKGFVRAGWVDNFVMGTLQLGGADVAELQLVDRFDNQPDSKKPDALYLRNLIVGPGSRLDLNGLNIYYLRARISDDAKIIGGAVERLAADWLVPGDATYDGLVNDDDLSVLLSSWRASEPLHDADFTGDDFVGDDDLSVLLSNWGGSSGGSSVVVPEPATLALLALAGLMGIARRRPLSR